MEESYPDQIDMMTETMLRDECRKLVKENIKLMASLAAQPSVRAELADTRKEIAHLRSLLMGARQILWRASGCLHVHRMEDECTQVCNLARDAKEALAQIEKEVGK